MLALVGCGDRMATVQGKLVFEGKPVTAGNVYFMPKGNEKDLNAGRPSTGAPDENGEFLLSTHARNDGALIGTHVVNFVAPTMPESAKPDPKVVENVKKFGNLRIRPGHTVEVKSGVNKITLELERTP